MVSVIIRQKDVKRLDRELLSEMFEFLHNEYILTEFEEMKEVQKEFLENLALNHINTLQRQHKITKEEREKMVNESIKYTIFSKLVKDAMEDEGIDTEGIYQTLNILKLDMEIDEDLYYKTKEFLEYFESGYSYL